MILELDNINFEESSISDPGGKIFIYENKILRLISNDFQENFRNILNLKNLNYLFDLGLVETRVSNYSIKGFPLVLEHKRVPFISYCSEWLIGMLRDSLIMVCNLSIELAKYGYMIIDIHPGNILFEKYNPIFIDFTSIVPINKKNEIPYSGLRKFFILPLWLSSLGLNTLSEYSMKEYPKGVIGDISDKRFLKKLPIKYLMIVRNYIKERNYSHQKSIIKFYENLKTFVESLKLKIPKGQWENYPQKNSKKNEIVNNILKNLQQGTLLDVACNKGYFSFLANDLGNKVVSFDYEEAVLLDLYRKIKKENKDILPLKINFLYPAPSFGKGLVYKSSFERLKCDTTLVISLIHHLVFKQEVNFEIISKIINNYTVKNSIVEFIPSDDVEVSRWGIERYSWYKIDNFIKSMQKYFNEYEVVNSSPLPRKLIIFKK